MPVPGMRALPVSAKAGIGGVEAGERKGTHVAGATKQNQKVWPHFEALSSTTPSNFPRRPLCPIHAPYLCLDPTRQVCERAERCELLSPQSSPLGTDFSRQL